MKPGGCTFPSMALAASAALVLCLPGSGQMRHVAGGLTPIAPSGVTVLKRRFPGAGVVVRIYASTLAGNEANACPVSRSALEAYRGIRATVVSDLSISVNGHDMVYVPTSAYASIYDPIAARIGLKGGSFVLKIHANAGGESEGYFVLLYFDSKTVKERKEFSELDERDPTEVTHYYAVTLDPPGASPSHLR